MTTTALWILAAALMLVGLAGIVLPALPGVPLLFAGMVVAAAIDDFQRIGWVTVSILGALTVIAFVVDIFAASIGAKRVGASGRAVWGAAIGTVIGIFFGVAGLLLGPFVGAVIGELSAHGRVAQAGRVGVATWLGLVLGTIVKLALACSMLGIFALAFFIR
jgi:uncharacterized protein YqgC (DUF456 family)